MHEYADRLVVSYFSGLKSFFSPVVPELEELPQMRWNVFLSRSASMLWIYLAMTSSSNDCSRFFFLPLEVRELMLDALSLLDIDWNI